jgi:hypothetical protein
LKRRMHGSPETPFSPQKPKHFGAVDHSAEGSHQREASRTSISQWTSTSALLRAAHRSAPVGSHRQLPRASPPQRTRPWVEDKGRGIRPGGADRMLTPWNPASGQGFALPLRGWNLSVERLPRVSPWAIILSSLREELRNRLYCVQQWEYRSFDSAVERFAQDDRPSWGARKSND